MKGNQKKKDVSFKEYFQIALWSLKVTWEISPMMTFISIFTRVVGSLRSLAFMYIFARLIDSLISMSTVEGIGVKDVFPFLLLLLLVNLAFSFISDLDNYSNSLLRTLSQTFLDRMAYQKVNELGVQSMEMPDIANMNQKMRDWIYTLRNIKDNVVRIISSIVGVLVSGTIIATQVPVILPMLLIVSVIFYFQRKYFFTKEFYWYTNDKNLEDRRRSRNLSFYLSLPRWIGEVGLTGAFQYLDKKFTNFFDYFNSGLIDIQKKSFVAGYFTTILSNIIIVFGYIQIFSLLFLKKISVGDTTFYMSSIDNFYRNIQDFFANIISFRDYVMKMKEVYQFFRLESIVEDGDIKLPRLEDPPTIEVKNMSFHYPNSEKNIFENFSLKIEAGQKIAIVGENGAGKTTLVKLISRIYDPQEGEMLVNGINLKNIKINDWYKNIGVLFQDFNFYGELTVKENIYIGKSIKKVDEESVIEAAKNADAHEFIMEYENGYDTVMSERFKDGIRPSNGQKQKIAIARFFYRNAPVAIFDEPTSAIDAESEYRIFNRIYDFFRKKTVVIISHRFSTVRNADRIIVLHEGKIVEDGTHEELMKNEGRYFSAFTKQAEGYVS